MRTKQAKQKYPKSRMFTLAIIGSLVLLAVGAYLLRTWLYTSAIPNHVNTVYKQDVGEVFGQTLSTMSERLQPYGLAFNNDQKNSAHAGCERYYSKLSATFSCAQGQRSDQMALNDDVRIQWPQNSKKLESDLLAEGWEKRNAKEPIETLLDKPNAGVSYKKVSDKGDCELSIWYNGPQRVDGYALNASLECRKEFNLFGGY